MVGSAAAEPRKQTMARAPITGFSVPHSHFQLHPAASPAVPSDGASTKSAGSVQVPSKMGKAAQVDADAGTEECGPVSFLLLRKVNSEEVERRPLSDAAEPKHDN